MVSEIPYVNLNNGLKMPIVGFGTYARKANPGQFRQAVEWAIDAGYRHIDTAAFYGNEEEVGQAIATKIKEGSVNREDLFITTKLWNDSHAENDVVPALRRSLEKLKLDYVDLFIIHWPVSVNAKGEDQKIEHSETWRGMEKTVELGLARSIGVSNFNAKQLKRLLETSKIKPAISQSEINPTFTAKELVEFCLQNSIVPVAYTPLGLLSDARPEFKGKDWIKSDPKLGEIAEKYKKDRAQIALRYLIQRGIPILPKSFTKSRIEENLNLFDFELSEDEMKTVESYNLDHRCVPALQFKNYKNYAF